MRDPKEFRERYARWKQDKEAFAKFQNSLPENLRKSYDYPTYRYWLLNGKPKDFSEAVGRGMYSVLNDNGELNWHAGSVVYNHSTDSYELMKSNLHPTRWMELVYGYGQNPEFQKEWRVEYNGPTGYDRYVRREKPGLKIKPVGLPSFAEGKETEEQEEVKYRGEITQGHKPSGIERAANWLYRKTGKNRMGIGGALQRAVDEIRDGRHPLNGLMKTGGAALFPYVGAAVEGAAAIDAANEITKHGLDIPNTLQLAIPTSLAGSAVKKLKYPSKTKPVSLGAVVDYHNSHPEVLTPMDKNSTEMQQLRLFYKDDVLPRFEKQMNKTGRTSSVTADELIDLTQYRLGPFISDNYGGYYGPTGVVMNSKYAKNGKMLSHETNHALRLKLGYTKEEDNILKEAYTFSDEYLKKHPGLMLRAEKSATNNEVRRAIAMKYNTKNIKELDSIIDNMPDEELMSLYNNSYGNDFKKSFKPGLKPQRKALKSVASIVPLLAAKGIILESFEDFDEELPGYAGGKEASPYRYTLAGQDNSWSRVSNDETGRVFLDIIARPLSRGGNIHLGSWKELWAPKGEPGLQIVSPEFDLLLMKGLAPNIRDFHIGNWYPKIPRDPNRYYRIVGRNGIDPIQDAIESGVIRGPGKIPEYRDAVNALGDDVVIDLNTRSPKLKIKAHDYPMFSKGGPWKGSTANVSKGKPTVIRSKANTGDIVWQESNKDFRHKGHRGIFRPTLNGDPNAAPSKYFEYFEPSKWFGYNRYNIVL